MKFNSILQIFCLIALLLVVMIWTIFMCHKLVKENSMEIPFEVINVTVTAYSPSPSITDSTPFITASNLRVIPKDLEQLKFISVSRDLIKKFKLEFGDVIYIGFEIQDTMAKKITNTIDIFTRNLHVAKAFGKQGRKIIILKKK